MFIKNHYGRNKTGQDYIILQAEKWVFNVLDFIFFHNINFKNVFKSVKEEQAAAA